MALVSSADGGSALIPYKNGPALAAYYLGVFSLSACLPFIGIVGLVMAVAALVLGIKGLRRVKENPEVHGTAHAWIGIICGAIFTLVGLAMSVLTIVMIVSMVAEQR